MASLVVTHLQNLWHMFNPKIESMNKSEIINKINEIKKEYGITHDELVEIIYEARDARLREIREEYQNNCLMFYFEDGLMVHQIKWHTIPEMVENYPTTLKKLVKDFERENGKLGMLVNSNIPKGWADFQMS